MIVELFWGFTHLTIFTFIFVLSMPEFKVGSHFFYPVKTVLKSGFAFIAGRFPQGIRNPVVDVIYNCSAAKL